MSIASRVQELQKKHQKLSKQLEDAQRQPSIDGLELTALKKKKLQLKEEIERLSHP